MKKSLRPPENWQDFETLCKKLFGEIWGCPHTIKKNGRLGQLQAGVDVYGKPKGETEYWGIQSKGKDNYEDKKLTENEIDEEIAKALTFEPRLKVFILATTASKDVHLEKYVRLKDQESCRNGGFQILLYCWQDLVDLIEENRDTFNWYVNNIQFKDQFDVAVTLDTGHEGHTVKPTFLKSITYYKTELPVNRMMGFGHSAMPAWMREEPVSIFGSNKVNHAWCPLDITVGNTGSIVLEDWKVRLFFPDNVRKVDDDFTKNIFHFEKHLPYRTTWAYEQEGEILYRPLNNTPLIQKDSRKFRCYCMPAYEAQEIKVKWQLLARNFDREGEFTLVVKPRYETKRETVQVYTSADERTETQISDFIETIK
jgi:hypothetical protein